ncbi:unnamed protein product [Mytilus coruscus]|uniref:Uncharacterized protein n=1 Tax=Mytilus coruscus TaxID=42192 RepID=A0A6J8EPS7_MYTCO|nr:unnamed protein product [Mytilus coruscus]
MSVVGGEQLLHYSPYGVNWNKAYLSCGVNGLEIVEEVLKRSDVLENQQFWIGKTPIFTPWIELIGCYEVHGLNKTELNSLNTRGECQKKCQHVKHFGFKKTSSRRCVCIPDEVLIDNQKNMSACEESYFYYVYKEFRGKVVDSDDPGNCMTLCCGDCSRGNIESYMFEGRNCDARDLSTIARCEDRNSSYWGATQNEGVTFCASKQQLLLPSTFCHEPGNSKFSGILAWTNVFREQITECFTTNCTTTRFLCPAGVINSEEGTKGFKKIEKACNESLQWFICSSNRSPITDQALYTTMSSSGMISKQIIDNQGNTETTLVKGISSGVTSFEKVKNDCQQGFTVTALIGAVIGGSVGFNLLCFGIILLVHKLRESILLKECNVLTNRTFWLGKAIYSKTSAWMEILGNDDPNQITSWSQNHDISLNLCMNKNQLLLAPLHYCTNRLRDQSTQSWTNVFREVYEYELTKAEGGNKTPLQCLSGHLVQHDGQWKLMKMKRDCNKHLAWFMCRNFDTKSTISSSAGNGPTKSEEILQKSSVTTSFPEIAFTTRTKVTKRKTSSFSITQITVTDLNTLPSLSLRTEKYMVRSTQTNGRIAYTINSTKSAGVVYNGEENIPQKDHSKEGNNSRTIGAVIGGLLGACSVITLLGVLIVCKLRSIGIFKESSKHHKQETSQIQFSKTTYQDSNNTTDKRSTTTTSNETYGLAENSTAVYAVVNKIKKPENRNETYTDAGNGEYDHLHDIQNRKICSQENLYHSHGAPRNKDDQTYDNSDFGKRKCNHGNSLYDQSFSVVEEEYSYSTNKIHDNSLAMSNTKVTWEDAVKMCQETNSVIEDSIDRIKNVSVPAGTHFWLPKYSAITPWIDLIGNALYSV